MNNGLMTGVDAIDVARICGVQLHRAPAHAGDTPDTSWSTAEASIKAGDSTPDDYYLDLDYLSYHDAGNIIACLVAMLKAVLDYSLPKHENCISSAHGKSI